MIKTVETRYGEMSYYDDDQFIGRSLALYGEYSELEVALWRRFIGKGDLVIDCGANIGALTIALAKLVGPEGHVWAFEPQPENFQLLRENLAGVDEVTISPLALGATLGSIKVPKLAELGHKNYGGVALGYGASNVMVTTLDLEKYQGPIKFIKIDVEGNEINVLQGARALIARDRPILYVEDHPDGKGAPLLEAIWSLGYQIYRHTPPLFNAGNFRGHQADVFERIVSFNALCIPVEQLEGYKSALEGLRPVPKPPAVPRWAGVARLGGIGDNLMAASTLKGLKAMGFKVDVITQKPQSVIFENNPYVDKLSIKETPRDIPNANQMEWANWFKSRSYEYDIFANLSHSCEYALAFVAHQTPAGWPARVRRQLANKSYVELVHDIVGVPYEFGRTFWPTPDELEQAAETRAEIGARGPLIGWFISGSRADKIYPHSPQAVARLIKELDATVVIMGAPAPHCDEELAKVIQNGVKHQNGSLEGLRCAISAEKWPIRRILTFAMGCDLVVTPDTGPAWAVAFEVLPKVVLLSHASPENITKHWVNTVTLHAGPQVHCWPCHRLHDTTESCLEEQKRCGVTPDPGVTGAACISSISVEAIVANVRRMLNGSRANGVDAADRRPGDGGQDQGAYGGGMGTEPGSAADKSVSPAA